jgi:hypothetical protein
MEIGGPDRGWPDEAFERRKCQANARLTLALLSRHDRIVASFDRLETRQDLSPAQIDAWREARRDEYRRATGVEIEQRDALKAALRQSAETGSQSVEEIVGSLRRSYAKGVSSSQTVSGERAGRF